jgi:FKBP-type peptidyl-prolyl cis-trans isomerase SlyD
MLVTSDEERGFVRPRPWPQNMSDTISKDMVASVHYIGTLSSGDEFDNSRDRDPLEFLVGHGNMIPGFEDEMMGAEVGEKRTFTLEAERGYGERDESGVQEMPRDAFPDEMPIEVGLQLVGETEQGPLPFKITAFSDTTVTIDFNHELAGEALTFNVEVMGLRAASEEEIAHGHAHGPGGHHH